MSMLIMFPEAWIFCGYNSTWFRRQGFSLVRESSGIQMKKCLYKVPWAWRLNHDDPDRYDGSFPGSSNFGFHSGNWDKREQMGDSDYSFSLTTFSPSGKLVQIEYALNAVAAGSTSLGIKGACDHELLLVPVVIWLCCVLVADFTRMTQCAMKHPTRYTRIQGHNCFKLAMCLNCCWWMMCTWTCVCV